MSLDSKVIWSEGMFLNPHHFQQQERYIERYVNGKCSAYGAYGWGMHECGVDSELLKLGKISVSKGKGVFPDGTPFSFPDQDDAPPVMEVPANTHDQIVYLGIPVRRPGAVEVLADSGNSQGLARYYSTQQPVRDATREGGEAVALDVGKLSLRLLLESDDLSGYACIGVLRINETRDDKNILLDERYIPTCLDSNRSPNLSACLTELQGLLHQRGESIAGRLADVNRGGAAEVVDYMMLQLINRYETTLCHLAGLQGLHPLDMFSELVQLAGEFATFVTQNKRPLALPSYRHDDMVGSFMPLMAELRRGLSTVYEQTAVSLALVEKKYGIKVAQLQDRSLLEGAMFVLAARADISEEMLRVRLPAQIKLGPVERIRQLVNAAMPGIPMRVLPVAPRQIPYHSGFAYFELERNNPFWNELQHSGGFAVHVGGDFPGLELELWAIRQ